MIKNNILINTETRAIKKQDYNFLGVAGENEIEQLVFKLTAFIDGIGIIEIQKNNEKFFIELNKEDEAYVLDVKNSLLSDATEISMQLHITTENTEVFKSIIFPMKIYDQIHATETIPDEYPEWIDTANAKIQEMLNLEELVEQSEQERNRAVQEAINNIVDMTDAYNQNASDKTNDFNTNAQNKTEDFDDFADERQDEIQAICDTARDFVSAVTFTTIEENFETGNLEVNNEESLGNMGFQFNYDTGNLEVEING